MLTFRPFNFSDQDYADVIALNHAVWVDNPNSEAEMRRQDRIRPKSRYFQRIIAEIDGKFVGYGRYFALWYRDVPNYYRLNWLTAADYRKQGICTAFYQYALAKMQADGRTISKLNTNTYEDQAAGVRWLTKRGFVEINRYSVSALKIADFNASQFADYPARITQHGLIIKPLAEIIPHDPDWQRKLYDLEWVFEQDEPNAVPSKRESFAEYIKDTLEDPGFAPAMWFMAVDSDRYAGMSCLWADKVLPHQLRTGWTGVDRPYRKKGLATALKLATINYAQKQPTFTQIVTENHVANWMYQINLRLGFKPRPDAVSFDKPFSNTG